MLSGKADSGEAADEVFTEGESGNVAETALESPLGADVAPTNEPPDVAQPPAVSAESAAAGDEEPAGDAAQASGDTADASADTAVS